MAEKFHGAGISNEDGLGLERRMASVHRTLGMVKASEHFKRE